MKRLLLVLLMSSVEMTSFIFSLLGVVFNQKTVGMATKATLAAFESQSNPSGIANILNKILKEDTLKNLQNGKKKFEDYDIPGADMDSFIKKFNSYEGKEDDLEILQIHRTFVDKVLPSFEQVNENMNNIENDKKEMFS